MNYLPLMPLRMAWLLNLMLAARQEGLYWRGPLLPLSHGLTWQMVEDP